jgi:hypothetical protein
MLKGLLVYADISDNYIIRSSKIKQHLLPFIHEMGVDCPKKTFPASTPETEFQKVPLLIPIIIPIPHIICGSDDLFLDSFIHLPAGNECNVQGVKGRKVFLVKKATVATQNNCNILPVFCSDEFYKIGHHIDDRISMVAVFTATTEDCIHDFAVPYNMQGLKTLVLFVGRLHAVTLFSIVVVHNHGINI